MALGRQFEAATRGLGALILEDQRSKREHEFKMLQLEKERKMKAAELGLGPDATWDQITTKTADLSMQQQQFRTTQIDEYYRQLEQAKKTRQATQAVESYIGSLDQSQDPLFYNELEPTLKEAGYGEQVDYLKGVGEFDKIKKAQKNLDLVKTDYTPESWKEYEIQLSKGIDQIEASKALVKDQRAYQQLKKFQIEDAIKYDAGILGELIREKKNVSGVPTQTDMDLYIEENFDETLSEMQRRTGKTGFNLTDLQNARRVAVEESIVNPVDFRSGLTLAQNVQAGKIAGIIKGRLGEMFGARPMDLNAVRLHASKMADELVKEYNQDPDTAKRMANVAVVGAISDHGLNIKSSGEIQRIGARNLETGIPLMVQTMKEFEDLEIEGFEEIVDNFEELETDGGFFSPNEASIFYAFGGGQGDLAPEERKKYGNVDRILNQSAKEFSKALTTKAGSFGISDAGKLALKKYGPGLFEYAVLDVWEGSDAMASLSYNEEMTQQYEAYKALMNELRSGGARGRKMAELIAHYGKAKQGLGVRTLTNPWLKNMEKQAGGLEINIGNLK